ncbi:MAG TPA: ABC transporter ATP-binding protein/permease [Candidatus Methylacidiphilales bacterium]|nr:ABC transporter ATP-binding protein/permease [Candidatus Methylacidiphilales bacterium]
MHTTAQTHAAIFVENISVTVGHGRGRKDLVRHISIVVPEGSFVSIIGASGCGKSTLLRALAGIQPVSAGRVLLAGHAVEILRRQLPLAVGYLPQFGAFHGDLTVAEILDFTVALRLPSTVPKTTREQWLQHVIDLARIGQLLGQKYRTLSGGQMRRIALAEELIGDPAFLFLDELTSGLDPYSEHELMVWLRELAHGLHKTVVLVTHAVGNLRLCDSIIFLHDGRLCYQGPQDEFLARHETESIEAIFGGYQHASAAGEFSGFDRDRSGELPPPPEPGPLNTAPPPGSISQLLTLIRRQYILVLRDRAQIWLHVALIVSFPLLVAIFATKGLPQVRNLSLSIETNPVQMLTEHLDYLRESFSAAALVSGLAMFQVILLTLMGANNGAREIAKERDVLEKELRAGLSPWAYVTTKGMLVIILSLVQAFWMSWFVKEVCGFPGSLFSQFEVLFLTTLAMSMTCVAISSASKSPERASLLAIYLVGLQLPLSGAVLALPEIVSTMCRPFIAAYWGWSGYLKTLSANKIYDIVRQSTDTYIADLNLSQIVLCLHTAIAGVIAWILVSRTFFRR